MRITRLDVRRFRGFEAVTILPSRHVVLVGEPSAGRSDLVEGLDRTFSPESTRSRLPTELDFYKGDTTVRAEVEVTLGDLGEQFEQLFLDYLEVWDRGKSQVLDELADPTFVDRQEYDLVVRLCYRAAWNEKGDQAEHWVDYPKTSDPEAGRFDRVGRTERSLLPFAVLHGRPRALDLGMRGEFRRLVESAAGGDFVGAIAQLEQQIQDLAGQFSATGQMSDALERVLAPLRPLIGLSKEKAADVVRFLPEGGSLSGLIRSLAPAIDLREGAGLLPLYRHGSTLAAMLSVAQAMATAGEQGIVVVDDFGEGLDGAAAQHLAATLRRSARQVWLSTRRTQVIEAFPLEELVRLGRDPVAARRVYYGRTPKSKTERLAVRHWASQLAPALTSRVAVVVEGPHDRAALTSLANRLHEEESVPLPAATRVALIDAATSDGSGGATAIPRLAKAAGELGLHTIAVLDYDRSEPDAKAALKACVEAASLVIRLPKGYAIELALLTGLDDDVVKAALGELRDAFGLTIKQDLERLSGPALHKVGCEILKQSAGLHAQYVHALPANVYPPLARRLLETAIGAAVDLTKGIAQKELRQL